MKVTVDIEGLSHVVQTMTEILPAAVASNVVAAALKEATRPMVAQAKRDFRALGGSGSLSIATTSWRNRRRERSGGAHFASVEVGPKRSNRRALAAYFAYYGRKVTPRQYQLGIRHGHLVEFGTKHGAPARRILGRAQAGHDQAAVQNFGRILARRIEETAAKRAAGQPGRRTR